MVLPPRMLFRWCKLSFQLLLNSTSTPSDSVCEFICYAKTISSLCSRLLLCVFYKIVLRAHIKKRKNYIEIFICPIHLCNFCINVNNILSPSGENHLSPCTVEAFYHLLRGGIIKSIEGFFRSLQPFVTRAGRFHQFSYLFSTATSRSNHTPLV